MNLKVKAVLDEGFAPMSVVFRDFEAAAKANPQEIVVAVVRNKGLTSTYKLTVFADDAGKDEENFMFCDRIVKSMLWMRGGYKIIIAGSEKIYNYFKKAYSKGGSREFDVNFMSRVYECPFEVEYIADVKNAPVDKEDGLQ